MVVEDAVQDSEVIQREDGESISPSDSGESDSSVSGDIDEKEYVGQTENLKKDKFEISLEKREENAKKYQSSLSNYKKRVDEITSNIILGNVNDIEWVDCEDCVIECPNCKRESVPFPGLNRMTHNVLFQCFRDDYISSIYEFAQKLVSREIMKCYEDTFRYQSLYKMICDTIDNSDVNGITFDELVSNFSDYSKKEVMWALYQYHIVDDYDKFIIFNDRILLVENIRIYLESNIDKESYENLLVLITWVAGDDDIFDLVDEKCGVPSGKNCDKFKNEELMLEICKHTCDHTSQGLVN